MNDDDDDLRFGDVKGSNESGGSGLNIPIGEGSVDLLIQGLKLLVVLYVILLVVETLFNVPIPFV